MTWVLLPRSFVIEKMAKKNILQNEVGILHNNVELSEVLLELSIEETVRNVLFNINAILS